MPGTPAPSRPHPPSSFILHPSSFRHPRPRPRAFIPLWAAITLAVLLILALSVWTYRQTRTTAPDGRTELVFWGTSTLGDDVYGAFQQFEDANPQYHVTYSNGAARDINGDAQRLMCTIAGGVPPDVVWFDRFAVGEWAARNALTDLTPYLQAQSPNDPDRIDPTEYYPWSLDEASYKSPSDPGPKRLYGIPTDADIRLLYLNSDVFRQAGLVDAHGNPTPPKDWDQLRAWAGKLTIYRNPKDKHSGITRLGFGPNFGNSWLYLYAFQAGGDFLNHDPVTVDGRTYPPFTRVTMDSPPVVKALRFMTDIYDDLGGVAQVESFKEAGQASALDPFLLGQVAMKVDVDNFMRTIADWNPRQDFKLVPAPLPKEEVAKRRPPVGWSGGFAYVIPASSRNKEGAFKLIKFLSSWHAVDLIERGRREQRQAEGRIYLPNGRGNRKHFEQLVKTYVTDDPTLPQTYKDAYTVVMDMFPRTMIRPVTPVGQLLWAQHITAYDAAVNHGYTDEARNQLAASGNTSPSPGTPGEGRGEGQGAAAESPTQHSALGTQSLDPHERQIERECQIALAEAQLPVQQQLDELLAPPPPHEVRWTPYLIGYAILLTLPFLAIYYTYKKYRTHYGYRGNEVAAAMLFLSPWVLGFAVFVGGPILFSIVFSFSRYDIINDARYVGVQNYTDLLTDPTVYKSILNTAFMILRVPLSMAVSLAMALLLNRAARGIGLYRAAFYLPAIVPLVASSLLWTWLLNPTYGVFNESLAWFYSTAPAHWLESAISLFTTHPFHFTLPLWLKDADWAKPSMILMGLWSAGGTMIIWLAGLQSIPPQLYEAASIDGATKWRQFLHVTLPMISPYILFNLIIGTIGTLKIFDEAYIMTPDGGPFNSTLFYAYYLFKQAFQFFRMGYASAMAWVLLLVVLAFTLLELRLSRKWVHYDQA